MKVKAKAIIPSRSDIKAKQREGTDSILARITLVRRSRPNQPKAKVMTAHLVPSSTQDGQPNPKANTEKSPSPPPLTELKPLPKHLKYAYLNKEQRFMEQEDKLLDVLRKHKKAIGWKLSNLLGINPSICMHRILMEEEIKPIKQQQGRLNPTILDVVKKEVTKLLATGIIYPISDSQWFSPVQVVPKKFGMTVMKNQHNELVPTRIQNSWRVYIDYRRLNQVTRKDHFPLPFIDQVLEKLLGRSHYCSLDGFSGYM
ncbi:Retrovirus-related Pol polyprotein, partial [Mucuna pruriens]